MKTRHFHRQLQRPRLEEAIRAAELKTSGEFVVIIHHRPVADAVAFAREEFLRRGLQKTRDRNGVLFFVAPESQTFAVIGDEGVHQKCGQPFWDELAAVMTEHFQRGEFTTGLLAGIERAGGLLAEHFPRRPDDTNELPDRVVEQ